MGPTENYNIPLGFCVFGSLGAPGWHHMGSYGYHLGSHGAHWRSYGAHSGHSGAIVGELADQRDPGNPDYPPIRG